MQAYDYVVNGKPAIEWIMERYAQTTDKDSGIKNDPNTWSTAFRYTQVSDQRFADFDGTAKLLICIG